MRFHFALLAPQNRCRTPSLPPSRNTIGTLLSCVFGPNFISQILTYAQPDEPGGSGTGHEYQAGAGPKHGELSCSHRTFLQFAGVRTVLSTHSRFITYPGAIPMPTSWQTLSCIRLRRPACGRRAHQEWRRAGDAEWFRYPQLVPQEAFPGYSEWEWHRELVSCSRARIKL